MPVINGEIKTSEGNPLPRVDRLVFSELRRLREAVQALPGGDSREMRLRFRDFEMELLKVLG